MSRRSRKNPRTCLYSLILPSIAVILFLVLVVSALVKAIPRQAEKIFGPPAVHLSARQLYTYSFLLLWQQKDLTEPVEPGGEPQPFRVGPGESVPSITGRLYQQGLIQNPGAFRTYLLYSGYDKTIQAGEYELSSAISALDIALALQDATPTEVSFGVLAGWRIEEIAATLPSSGLSISPDEFLQEATRRPAGYSFTAELPSPSTLEGFFLPGVYRLNRAITAPELIQVLLMNFEAEVTTELRNGYRHQGLSLYEAVTLASMVQKESVVESDMPLIASVFYNRLAINMKLDSDPTVQYSIGYNEAQDTWWTNPLSLNDLRFDSPYNTYLYRGLPPGPIGSPSLQALRAAAYPAQTPYYYFRAGCDGSGRHLFAVTFEEHLNNACP